MHLRTVIRIPKSLFPVVVVDWRRVLVVKAESYCCSATAGFDAPSHLSRPAVARQDNTSFSYSLLDPTHARRRCRLILCQLHWVPLLKLSRPLCPKVAGPLFEPRVRARSTFLRWSHSACSSALVDAESSVIPRKTGVRGAES